MLGLGVVIGQQFKEFTARAILSDPSNALRALERFEHYAYQHRLAIRKRYKLIYLKPGTKVFIFGAGEAGKRCLDLAKEEKATVLGFIDNDENKQDSAIEGISIFSPERLKEKGF
ncbi:MAG: hypothetical protein QME40_07040 [bacterium]|nr:hypothetical protein [bacterium]